MAFEVAIYTDVVASEAVDGVDGFNFQAVSPELTATDQQRIREGILHRVIPDWSIGHDELSHPPTCAYVVQDGRSYLARGRSTGTTNSGRPGNQLTQTIVTSDADDFVPYRPAQLYGALEWSLKKAPGSQLDAWVSPLEIRPEFEVGALEEFVRADEWAAAILPQYLTMLDEVSAAEPKKLVLIHRELDVVMRWIALGTLFVEGEAARALQFRALVDDPWRANAQIVGVSPEFGSADFSPANVLDLELRTVPNIVPSAAANVRAAWFLEQGADDALNAIEIARRWESALGPTLANEAARIVGLPDDALEGRRAWKTSMTVIEKLAGAGLREDLALYAEELCEATLAYGPASEGEFRLAGRAIRHAHEVGVDDLASGIVVPTLEALAAAPMASAGFSQELSAVKLPITWTSADAQEAAGAFLGEVLAGASAQSLPEAFTAARVVGAPVPEAKLRAAVATLAACWLKEPALGQGRWQRWLSGQSVVAALVRQLLIALSLGDQETMVNLRRGDWDFLARIVDDTVLIGWLNAGQLGRVPLRHREDQIALTTRIPADAWRIVLAGSELPAHAGLWAAWIKYHGLPDELAALVRSSAEGALQSAPGDDDAPRAGDWSPVMRGVAAAADPELVRLSREYARAKSALTNAGNDVSARPSARLDGCLPYVSALAPLFLTDLGWLLLSSRSAEEVEKLLDASVPWGPESVRVYLVDMAKSGHGLLAVEHALRNRGHPRVDLAAAAEEALAEIVQSQPDVADLARRELHLRGDLEEYLRQRAHTHEAKRSLGGPFGRGKES